MPFSIIRNDITKVKADAIVNTANPDVTIGDGVDAAIYKAAGEEKLLAARKEIGFLEPGEAAITPAFDLGAKYIIHASGPWWEGGDYGEERLLRQCYDKSLELAAKNGCESIAFPLLATGTYGFPKELGIQIAIDAFTVFLEDHEMDITLVVFGEDAYHVSGKLFDDVKSFIDDEYVGAALQDEYSHDGIPNNQMLNLQSVSAFSDDEDSISDDMPIYDGANKKTSKQSIFTDAVEAISTVGKAKSLDDELKGMYTDSLEKHLKKLINKKGLKNSEVYTAACISKQYFSKLLKGQVKPSKEKMLSLAIGLRLNMDETVDFLRLGGYAFSPISQTDVVVRYFIIHEDYSVMKIDIVLFDYGLDPLSNG